MKVGELKKILNDYDDQMEIKVGVRGYGHYEIIETEFANHVNGASSDTHLRIVVSNFDVRVPRTSKKLNPFIDPSDRPKIELDGVELNIKQSKLKKSKRVAPIIGFKVK